MHFGFALELSNVDLLNIDLLDTHLDLLDTDIPSKYFACLHNVFKTSSRHVFKTFSRHGFKTSSRHVFKMSSRRLQDKTNKCLLGSEKNIQQIKHHHCCISNAPIVTTKDESIRVKLDTHNVHSISRHEKIFLQPSEFKTFSKVGF